MTAILLRCPLIAITCFGAITLYPNGSARTGTAGATVVSAISTGTSIIAALLLAAPVWPLGQTSVPDFIPKPGGQVIKGSCSLEVAGHLGTGMEVVNAGIESNHHPKVGLMARGQNPRVISATPSKHVSRKIISGIGYAKPAKFLKSFL